MSLPDCTFPHCAIGLVSSSVAVFNWLSFSSVFMVHQIMVWFLIDSVEESMKYAKSAIIDDSN